MKAGHTNSRFWFLLSILLFSISMVIVAAVVPSERSEAKLVQGMDISEQDSSLPDQAAVEAAIAVQNRHTRQLMALPDVVGTATGITEKGKPAILVLTKKAVPPGLISQDLDGVPVRVEEVGEIVAMKKPGTVAFSNTGILPLPVPIGVSTGNIGECSAGTIGARVVDKSGNKYALSNNHVYALENSAASGSLVLQPGRYDTACSSENNNQIGRLTAFEPISFGGAENTIDAAIAALSGDTLGNATPPAGYGTPKSSAVTATIGMSVQKYGRTTSLTRGTVTGINVTISVSYSTGTAIFANQILVQSRKAFIKAGDSGSLLVTDPGREPAGLLFAGNTPGTYAFANPITPVLDAFGVQIDGEQ